MNNNQTASSHTEMTTLRRELDLLRAQQREMYKHTPDAVKQKLGFTLKGQDESQTGQPDFMATLLAHKKNDAQLRRNVRVSLHYKYTWFPVSKVANSSIKYALYTAELRPAQRRMVSDTFGKLHDPLYSSLLTGFQIPAESDLFYRAYFSDEFYRFGFVRHPYARVLSCYLDRVADMQKSVSKEIHRMAQDNLGIDRSPVSFEEFVQVLTTFDGLHRMNEHYRPCYHELFAGDVPLDFVGRFETLNEDWATVRDHLGLDPSITLGHKHPKPTSAADKLRKYYTPTAKRLVDEIYADDFEAYGYERDFDAV
jgi:hypothetical protein